MAYYQTFILLQASGLYNMLLWDRPSCSRCDAVMSLWPSRYYLVIPNSSHPIVNSSEKTNSKV